MENCLATIAAVKKGGKVKSDYDFLACEFKNVHISLNARNLAVFRLVPRLPISQLGSTGGCLFSYSLPYFIAFGM